MRRIWTATSLRNATRRRLFGFGSESLQSETRQAFRRFTTAESLGDFRYSYAINVANRRRRTRNVALTLRVRKAERRKTKTWGELSRACDLSQFRFHHAERDGYFGCGYAALGFPCSLVSLFDVRLMDASFFLTVS